MEKMQHTAVITQFLPQDWKCGKLKPTMKITVCLQNEKYHWSRCRYANTMQWINI